MSTTAVIPDTRQLLDLLDRLDKAIARRNFWRLQWQTSIADEMTRKWDEMALSLTLDLDRQFPGWWAPTDDEMDR